MPEVHEIKIFPPVLRSGQIPASFPEATFHTAQMKATFVFDALFLQILTKETLAFRF